jgi:hypothetical protein
MPVSGRAVDRLASMVIYAGFGVLALWAGTKLINSSLETKLYKDFLLKWEVAVQRFNTEGGHWPHFSGGNHVAYMDLLTQFMDNKGTPPPSSNTDHAYIYRLHRWGWPEERIFLLCFSNRVVLYGVSDKTFLKMDNWIDGGAEKERERFTGRRSKDGVSYVGIWKL